MNVTRMEKDYSQNQKRVKIAMNKSLLKEFRKDLERVVYLEDGDEFQIQIFNDQTTEICAKIFVNDESIGSSGLVINPGERVWLDRYLDRALKFKFKTYEVNGNSRDVQRAIKNNGIVKVQLFRKQQNQFSNWNINYTPYVATINPFEPQVIYCNSEPSTMELTGTSTISQCRTFMTEIPFSEQKFSAKIETGRISEGSHSNQKFDYVDMSFECYAFDTEIIHILPKSTKPVQITDLQKTYCANCGRKLNTKFKYCPYCGNKVE